MNELKDDYNDYQSGVNKRSGIGCALIIIVFAVAIIIYAAVEFYKN